MKIRKIVSLILLASIISLLVVPVCAVETSTPMVQMHELSSERCKEKDEIVDSYGTTYSDNIIEFATHYSGYITYDLKGKYSSFNGMLTASTNTSSYAEMNFAIFADGKPVFSVIDYTRQKEGIPISIDLTGVNTLEFKSSEQENYSDAWLYIVDGLFSSAQVIDEKCPVWSKLNDVVLVDSQHYEASVELLRDSYGDLHSGEHRFNALYDGYALYNINGEYETFSGTIAAYAGAKAEALMNVTIYLNNDPVYYQYNVSKIDEPISFSLDVTGIKTIKIETSYSSEWNYSDSYLYITDDMLLKHIHTPGEWVVSENATCVKDGMQLSFCMTCGGLVYSEKIPATGHVLSGDWEEMREATCSSEGSKTISCAVCNEIVETSSIDKKPHDFGNWEKSKEKWGIFSFSKERICSICGAVEKKDSFSQWIIPALIFLLLVIAFVIIRLHAKKKAISKITARKKKSRQQRMTASSPDDLPFLDFVDMEDLDDLLISLVDDPTNVAGSSSTPKTLGNQGTKTATQNTASEENAWPAGSVGERRKR